MIDAKGLTLRSSTLYALAWNPSLQFWGVAAASLPRLHLRGKNAAATELKDID